MKSVTVGAMSYVVENPSAAELLERAAAALRGGDLDGMRKLRRLAALVEDGKMTEEDAFHEADPVAVAA